MNYYTTYAISLLDHVATLKEWIADLKSKDAWREKSELNKRYSPEFNHVAFFAAMFEEVFEKIKDPTKRNYAVPISLLVEEGLEYYYAEYICSQMYMNLLTQISTLMPKLSFSKLKEHEYNLVGEYDLYIMVPNEPSDDSANPAY